MSDPENAGRNQDGTFAPGTSGNTSGKPKGARHRATQLVERLFMDEADVESIAKKVVEAAKVGEQWAVTAILQRIAPPRRAAPVKIELPKVVTAADITIALSAILAAVADGTIDPDEGRIVADIIETKRRAIETTDLAMRLDALENQLQNRRQS